MEKPDTGKKSDPKGAPPNQDGALGAAAKGSGDSGQEDLLDTALVEVIVAENHSVFDGKTHHKPGAVLMLSKEEAEALRRKGFLHDAEATLHPKGIGPSFTPEDGPKITRAS